MPDAEKGWSKVAGLQRPTLDEEMALLAAEEAFAARQRANGWDERGCCHECGHWRAEHCNADGFAYCDEHYPEGWR